MKQIVSFNIARLRVEEDFGFLKLIATETDNLPKNGEEDRPGELSMTASVPTTLTTSVTTFKNAVDAFDNALKDSASTPSTALAAEADSARDNAWRGANNYLKAMTAHPANDVRQTAIEAKTLFDKYGDPTTLPQTEESGVLHNLLQDLKAIDGSKLTAITFDTWLANLESCETAFLAAVSQRTEEEAARQVGIVKETRQAADNAYRSLVELVNALTIVNDEAPYATYIDHVNAIIDRQKTVLKTRQTKSRKEEKPVL